MTKQFLNPKSQIRIPFNARRWFLSQCRLGLGAAALGQLLGTGRAAAAPTLPRSVSEGVLAPRQSHFPAKAKAVIHLFMAGAPSQLDLFDYKPRLSEFEGKP